jgi:hypothetical protein
MSDQKEPIEPTAHNAVYVDGFVLASRRGSLPMSEIVKHSGRFDLIVIPPDNDHKDGFRVFARVVGYAPTIELGDPPKGLSPALPSMPSTAEKIISYVCTPDQMEMTLGCLQEGFTSRVAKVGEKAARRWYWWQTVRTVMVFGVQTVVKFLMLWELLRKAGR